MATKAAMARALQKARGKAHEQPGAAEDPGESVRSETDEDQQEQR